MKYNEVFEYNNVDMCVEYSPFGMFGGCTNHKCEGDCEFEDHINTELLFYLARCFHGSFGYSCSTGHPYDYGFMRKLHKSLNKGWSNFYTTAYFTEDDVEEPIKRMSDDEFADYLFDLMFDRVTTRGYYNDRTAMRLFAEKFREFLFKVGNREVTFDYGKNVPEEEAIKLAMYSSNKLLYLAYSYVLANTVSGVLDEKKTIDNLNEYFRKEGMAFTVVYAPASLQANDIDAIIVSKKSGKNVHRLSIKNGGAFGVRTFDTYKKRHQKLDFEDRPDIIIDKNLNIVKVDEDWNYTAHDEMWGSGSSASWLNRQWGL